jgi:hypothetical protein
MSQPIYDAPSFEKVINEFKEWEHWFPLSDAQKTGCKGFIRTVVQDVHPDVFLCLKDLPFVRSLVVEVLQDILSNTVVEDLIHEISALRLAQPFMNLSLKEQELQNSRELCNLAALGMKNLQLTFPNKHVRVYE